MDKKKHRIMNINSELPPEILNIMFHKLYFSKLPFCRLVCRAWNSLNSSSKFHCNLFITSDPPKHLGWVDLDHLKGIRVDPSFKLRLKWSNTIVANSCNGLLCVTTRNMKTRTDSVAILNLITNEYKDLPGEVGFRPKTKQYKVVRHHLKTLQSKTFVEIFAFGTRLGEWSKVAFDTFRMEKGAFF